MSAVLGTRPLAQRLSALQSLADQVSVHQLVADYVVRLVMATRSPAEYGLAGLEENIEIGVSPRATLGLVAAGRALALLRGRDYLLPDDIRDVAEQIITHLTLDKDRQALGPSEPLILVAPEIRPSQG